MIQIYQISFGFIERMSRAFVGLILLLLSFGLALSSEWIATLHFAALYPLFTALIAWDPIYVAIDLIKDRWVDFWILR